MREVPTQKNTIYLKKFLFLFFEYSEAVMIILRFFFKSTIFKVQNTKRKRFTNISTKFKSTKDFGFDLAVLIKLMWHI